MRSGTTIQLVRDVGPSENVDVVEDETMALIYALATPHMKSTGQELLYTKATRRRIRDCENCGYYTQITVEGHLDR